MTITTNELALSLAAQLNGREYREEITKAEEAKAKADGLVAVFGYSDDNVEFRGAIHDEIGAWEGTTVALTTAGLVNNDCDNDDCPHFKRAKERASKIKAVWHDAGAPCWTFETEIPHATFAIAEDNDLFCRGIVFALRDLPA